MCVRFHSVPLTSTWPTDCSTDPPRCQEACGILSQQTFSAKLHKGKQSEFVGPMPEGCQKNDGAVWVTGFKLEEIVSFVTERPYDN